MHRVLTPRAGGVGGSGAMGERMREAFCARAALSALSRSKDPREAGAARVRWNSICCDDEYGHGSGRGQGAAVF
eukprot:2184882-Rhodomonas_salina.4